MISCYIYFDYNEALCKCKDLQLIIICTINSKSLIYKRQEYREYNGPAPSEELLLQQGDPRPRHCPLPPHLGAQEERHRLHCGMEHPEPGRVVQQGDPKVPVLSDGEGSHLVREAAQKSASTSG